MVVDLKKSYTLTQVTNHLTQWSIILVGSSNPNERINKQTQDFGFILIRHGYTPISLGP